MRPGTVWEVAVLLIGLALLLGVGVNSGFTEQARPQTVENESVTVDYDSNVSVDGVEYGTRFADNASAYNASGAPLSNGTDWVWQPYNGSIDWLNTTNTTDGETASVTYTQYNQTQTTHGVASIFAPLGNIIGVLALAVGVAALLYYGAGIAGGGGW